MPRSHPARPGRRAQLLAATACLLAAAGPLQAQTAAPSPYGRELVFGDSLSDGGSYGDIAPPGGGSFTTNPDPVWVEVIAAGLGLPLTPHVAGGTNYAEGGARVATPRPDAPGNEPRTPVVNQVDNFLAGGGTFDAGDLVIIQGGGNDVFATQANGLSFTPADLAVLDKAAQDLAGQVRRIADAGRATIITTSVPQFEEFNSRYRAALAATGLNVLYFDVAGLISEIQTNPGEFGILHTTGRACPGGPIDSYKCLPQNYITPDANRTYLFADAVHFTGVVHEIEGDALLATLRAPAQIGQLPLAGQAELEAGHAALASQLRGQAALEPGRWSAFSSVTGDWLDVDTTARSTGLQTRGASLMAGLEHGVRPGLTVGGAVRLAEGAADFGQDSGKFQHRSVVATAYGRGRLGAFDALADVSYGDMAFDDVERRIVLGPAQRVERGDTDGRLFAAGLELGYAAAAGPLRVRPHIDLRYERAAADAYAEEGDRSTQITFGDQTLKRLLAGVGADLTWAPAAAWPAQPFASLSYQSDLLDRDRSVTITPHGAPLSFTTPAYAPDPDYFRYAVGVTAPLGAGASAIASLGGTVGRKDMDAVSLDVGIRARF